MVARARVFRIPMADPGDVSGLAELFDSGLLKPEHVVAVLGKTEGNGCVNDFTRGYASSSFKHLLADRLDTSLAEVGQRVMFVMSGGTEGILSPHCTVFARESADPQSGGAKRLAIGTAFTREYLPEEIGTTSQVDAVAKAVAAAVAEAGIHDPADVHFVQIKCPLLTSERVTDARRRGKEVVTDDTYKSMGYSRGASALGVAIALGEVDRSRITDGAILHDWGLHSGVASTSAGIEMLRDEIVVMGNAPGAPSDLVIGHSVMKDALDATAVRDALVSAGLSPEQFGSPEWARSLVNVFAKAEADPTGYVRGRRHTMLNDSDINSTRHARAVVGGVIASVVGDPMIYVSGGAEHQGPPGGGPVAAIVRASSAGIR